MCGLNDAIYPATWVDCLGMKLKKKREINRIIELSKFFKSLNEANGQLFFLSNKSNNISGYLGRHFPICSSSAFSKILFPPTVTPMGSVYLRFLVFTRRICAIHTWVCESPRLYFENVSITGHCTSEKADSNRDMCGKKQVLTTLLHFPLVLKRSHIAMDIYSQIPFPDLSKCVLNKAVAGIN